MRDVGVSELVNEWTHVTSGHGHGSGSWYVGDDGSQYEATTEGPEERVVSMSVGSRRYTAEVGGEVHDGADGKVPFRLRVEDRHGKVLWDMAWTWGCA